MVDTQLHQTTTFAVGDKVRMTADYKSGLAVPLGREGVVIEVEMWGRHIVVDFGHPYGERGCRDGDSLERVPANGLSSSTGR